MTWTRTPWTPVVTPDGPGYLHSTHRIGDANDGTGRTYALVRIGNELRLYADVDAPTAPDDPTVRDARGQVVPASCREAFDELATTGEPVYVNDYPYRYEVSGPVDGWQIWPSTASITRTDMSGALGGYVSWTADARPCDVARSWAGWHARRMAATAAGRPVDP